jgi:tRNA-specific 2-thiouridylase
MKKKIVVGLSGGVDSSVAALLLKEQGYEVIGMYMKNWHDDSVTLNNECPWIEDSNDALVVAETLGIPFQTLDLSSEYRKRIVDYMFEEYSQGRTPNPDVLCNREIKFDVFLKAALSLGADGVATGHYCRKSQTQNGIHRLLAGKDLSKDQSYFLCQISQEQLSMAHFPVGNLLKTEVRSLARKAGLTTANKKDSQGLCFVGKIKLPDFLQQQLKTKKGLVVEIEPNAYSLPLKAEMGKVIGEHKGAHFYTIGQRKGLNIGGKPKPLFVLATDTQQNILYVGQGEDHPALFRGSLWVDRKDINWIRPDLKMKAGETRTYLIRIRYRQPLSEAKFFMQEDGLKVEFEKPLSAVTPGQFVAWYEKDELLGSGVIGF